MESALVTRVTTMYIFGMTLHQSAVLPNVQEQTLNVTETVLVTMKKNPVLYKKIIVPCVVWMARLI